MAPKTKAPAPSRKLVNERLEALQRMSKAELVKTIRKLDANQTKLLNRIAELEALSGLGQSLAKAVRLQHKIDAKLRGASQLPNVVATQLPNPFADKFPWETGQ